MAEYDDHLQTQDDEEELQIITMTGDEGEDTDFIVINCAVIKKVTYFLIVKAEDFDEDEPEAYIIKEVGDNGSQVSFEFVDDDNEYAQAAVVLSGEDGDYELIF